MKSTNRTEYLGMHVEYYRTEYLFERKEGKKKDSIDFP